jgi:hypothetical protein
MLARIIKMTVTRMISTSVKPRRPEARRHEWERRITATSRSMNGSRHGGLIRHSAMAFRLAQGCRGRPKRGVTVGRPVDSTTHCLQIAKAVPAVPRRISAGAAPPFSDKRASGGLKVPALALAFARDSRARRE